MTSFGLWLLACAAVCAWLVVDLGPRHAMTTLVAWIGVLAGCVGVWLVVVGLAT